MGPVPVWLDTDRARIWMAQRPATFGESWADRSIVAAMLGLADADLVPRVPVQVVSSGNPFLFVALRDRSAVDRAELDQRRFVAALGDQEVVGAFVFAVDGDREGSVYSRMLSGRGVGIVEDPATGSASGPLGAFLVAHGLVPHADVVEVVSHQGVAMGRPSEVHVRVHTGDGRLEVGGGVAPVLTGTLVLPADA